MNLDVVRNDDRVDLVDPKVWIAGFQPIKESSQDSVVGETGIEVADLGGEKLDIPVGGSFPSAMHDRW